MISGFVILSEPERFRYPYLESIKSFLPLCDEIIAVCNVLKDDGSTEKLKGLDPKVKVIGGLFDYERFGWASQGIMRTNGYYACAGDMALMFDADGILHERDIEKAREVIKQMHDNGTAYGFWMKRRFNKRDKWVRQCKHSGIYNKSILGNNFNFYGGKANYRPAWEMIPEDKRRAQNTDVWIYGYERCWDTREIFDYKLKQRRIMEMSAHFVPSEEDYVKGFIRERQEKIAKEGQFMPIEEQPQIIQDKLRSINEEQFGYNLFRGEK